MPARRRTSSSAPATCRGTRHRRAGGRFDRPAARRIGVPAEAVVLEGKSRNTHENAIFTAAILKDKGWRSVLLVTSAGHMRRAMAAFRKAGVAATAATADVRGPLPGLQQRARFPAERRRACRDQQRHQGDDRARLLPPARLGLTGAPQRPGRAEKPVTRSGLSVIAVRSGVSMRASLRKASR